MVMLDSVRRHDPEVDIGLVLVDRKNASADVGGALRAFDVVFFAEDLAIEDFDRWIFGHTVVEAATAVKGPMAVRLLRDYDKVVYLDPDICLYASLELAWDLLDGRAAVLTPHLLDPEGSLMGILDNELSALRHGIFNLGFLGMSKRNGGEAIATWWAARLLEFCRDDVSSGMFTDQKWMDLAPAIFDGVSIIRDPGYNVASWNINMRRTELAPDGCFRVNGRPLVFWHFTKAIDVGPSVTMKATHANAAVGAIWRDYLERLRRSRESLGADVAWSYGLFSDGTPIPAELKRAYRDSDHMRSAYPHPYRSREGLFAWRGWRDPSVPLGRV